MVIPELLSSYRGLLLSSLFALLLALPNEMVAQEPIVCDGEVQTISADGSFHDFIIPNDPAIQEIEMIAKGGDGGFARLSDNCFSDGGEGATATAIFKIGDGPDEIPHGSSLRFIVGKAGEKGTGSDVLGTGFTYGGGGGGSAIMYKAPDSDDWLILMVAGGGGGAYQGRIVGICVDSEDGQGGRAGTDAGSGNGDIGVGQGGTSGQGGGDGFEVSGGGGGAFTDGDGITCIEIIGTIEVAE